MSNKSQVKLTLTRELDNGGTEAEQITVKKLRFRQFNRVFSCVAEILESVEQHPELRDVVVDIFNPKPFEPSNYVGFSPEELKEEEKKFIHARGIKMAQSVLTSFHVLLRVLPEQAAELLSAMTRIDKELLLDQEYDTVLDVLDATVEVNDLEELVVRGKQSFGTVKKAVNFLLTEPEESNEVANVPQP